MGAWHHLERGRVRIACRDFGGEGPPALLLHGLAGHAEEWSQTASWLTQRCRVLASDARGHGRSEHRPPDVSREAHVADAAHVLEALAPGPALVVGQSLGGLTAISLAARRPELVRAVVIADAGPAGGAAEAEAAVAAIGEALREWPLPFPSRAAAMEFFQERFGGRVAAEAWTLGLVRGDGGWHPRFDRDVIVRTLQAFLAEPAWGEWVSIRSPVLVVRAAHGSLDAAQAEAMTRRLADARLVEIADAAHDVHLDRPEQWRAALGGFLDDLARPAVGA